MNKLFNLIVIACLLLCGVVLVLFVFDDNTSASYIHFMEMENNLE